MAVLRPTACRLKDISTKNYTSESTGQAKPAGKPLSIPIQSVRTAVYLVEAAAESAEAMISFR